MKQIDLLFVPKDSIKPQFGRQFGRRILCRDDLPLFMQASIAGHEVYHEGDKPGFWLWREFKAIVMPIIGTVAVALYSLAPYRIAYYIRRFKEGR